MELSLKTHLEVDRSPGQVCLGNNYCFFFPLLIFFEVDIHPCLYLWLTSDWCWEIYTDYNILLVKQIFFCNEIFFCNKISFSVVVYWYMCHHGTLHRHGNIRLLFGFSPWNMWNIRFNLIVTKILWNSENEAAIIF